MRSSPSRTPSRALPVARDRPRLALLRRQTGRAFRLFLPALARHPVARALRPDLRGTAEGFVQHLAVSLVEPYGTLWFVYLLAVFSVATKLLRGVPPPLLIGAAAILQIVPIDTGWTVVDEFCARFVYFLAGY